MMRKNRNSDRHSRLMNELKVLRRAEGGTTSGSQFVAPTIGNVSQAGRDSVSQARIQDLLSRFKAPDVPDRYADGGDIISPQDEMQEEFDAEVAAMSSGSASGLGSFFEDLLYGGQDPSEFSEMDLRPEFIRDMPEIPEEVEIAMSIVGPGKGKGIGSLIDQAGSLKGLGKKLTDSMRDRQPSLPSPKRGRDFEEEPMSGREFIGYKDAPRPPSPRDTEMKIMRDTLKKDSPSTRSEGDYDIENLRRAYSKPRIDPDRMAAGGRPGLYANINAKRKRIAAGSGERMRKPGSKGAPTAANFKQAKTAKLADGGNLMMRKGYYGKSYK